MPKKHRSSKRNLNFRSTGDKQSSVTTNPGRSFNTGTSITNPGGAASIDTSIESSSLGAVSIDKAIKSSTNIQLNMFDRFNDIVYNQGQQKGNNEIFINI